MTGLLCSGPSDRQRPASARVGAQLRLMNNLGSTFSARQRSLHAFDEPVHLQHLRVGERLA